MVEWGKIFTRESSTSNVRLIGVAAAVLLLCVSVTAGQGWHCGRAATTIMAMCDSCYASLDKRAGPAAGPASGSSQSYTPAKPFLHKRNAVHFLRTVTRDQETPSFGDTQQVVSVERRSGHKGFVSECCSSFCDPGEMILYCCEERQREWARFHKLLKA